MTFNTQINSKYKAYRRHTKIKNYWIIYVVRYLFIPVLAFYGIYHVITLFYTIYWLLLFIKNTVKKLLLKYSNS